MTWRRRRRRQYTLRRHRARLPSFASRPSPTGRGPRRNASGDAEGTASEFLTTPRRVPSPTARAQVASALQPPATGCRAANPTTSARPGASSGPPRTAAIADIIRAPRGHSLRGGRPTNGDASTSREWGKKTESYTTYVASVPPIIVVEGSGREWGTESTTATSPTPAQPRVESILRSDHTG